MFSTAHRVVASCFPIYRKRSKFDPVTKKLLLFEGKKVVYRGMTIRPRFVFERNGIF